MRETIKFLFISAVIVILQMTLLNRFTLFGAKPEILLALTIFFSLYGGAISGLAAGLIFGFASDIFSAHPLGVNTFAFSIIGFFLAVFKDKLFRESIFTQFILIFISCFFTASVYFFAIQQKFNPMSWNLLETIFSISAYTCLYSFFLFFFLRKIFFVKRF